MAKVYLAEITAYDPGVPGVITLYYSSGLGMTTAPGETPANTFWAPHISRAPTVSRSIFGRGGTTFGRTRVGFGDLILDNPGGALDALNTYGFDGRVIKIYRGEEGAAFPGSFTTILVATIEQAEVTSSAVTIKLRDRIFELEKNLQDTLYLGDNVLPAGLEGVADDLKGKPKPLCYGDVENVAPPMVNTSKLIFQVNDGAVDTVDAVYDRGIALTSGGTYASEADLLDDLLEPDPGEFKYYAAGGYFRLGSSPDGLITADVTQGAAATDRYAAQLWKQVLEKAGMIAADYSAADITALDTAAAYVCGLWLGTAHTKATDALDQISSSVGAWWGPDRLGVFRIKQFVAPSGSNAAEFVADDLLGPLERITSRDNGKGIPSYKTVVQYRHNPNVQTFLEPGIPSGPHADRPPFGEAGRYWLSTSGVSGAPILYRDTGSAWVRASDATVNNSQNLAWLTATGSLSKSGFLITCDSNQIRLGSATSPTSGTGIFQGLSGGLYHFRAGNPSGDRIHWNGSSLTVIGGGTFSGALSAATGTFAGDLSAAGGTFSGDLSAAGGTFSGDITAATGTFSGTVGSTSFTGATAAFTGALQVAGLLTAQDKIDCTGEMKSGTILSGSSVVGALEVNGNFNHNNAGAQITFFNGTLVSKQAGFTQTYSTANRTISAYTPDVESSAYTGAVGDGEATLADLNALRVAYENLRLFTEDGIQALNSVIDTLQAYNLV